MNLTISIILQVVEFTFLSFIFVFSFKPKITDNTMKTIPKQNKQAGITSFNWMIRETCASWSLILLFIIILKCFKFYRFIAYYYLLNTNIKKLNLFYFNLIYFK